jgi:hypothetical protein
MVISFPHFLPRVFPAATDIVIAGHASLCCRSCRLGVASLQDHGERCCRIRFQLFFIRFNGHCLRLRAKLSGNSGAGERRFVRFRVCSTAGRRMMALKTPAR